MCDTKREPLGVTGGWAFYAYAPEYGWPPVEFDLPGAVFGALTGAQTEATADLRYKLYPTREAALLALRRAEEAVTEASLRRVPDDDHDPRSRP